MLNRSEGYNSRYQNNRKTVQTMPNRDRKQHARSSVERDPGNNGYQGPEREHCVRMAQAVRTIPSSKIVDIVKIPCYTQEC